MKLKRLLLFAALLPLFLTATAQEQEEMKVVSFKPLEFCSDATSVTGRKLDQNGKVCALIKVVTTEKSLSFENGALDVIATQQKPGEMWVWIPQQSRNFSILHADYAPIRGYDFDGYNIESGRCYELVLSTPKKQVQEVIATPKCSLNIKSDIQGDSVYINNAFAGLTPYTISLEAGDYVVKVIHEEYVQERNVSIHNEIFKEEVFKFVRTYYITTDKIKDDIYVDGRYRGYTPQNIPLSYGKHVIRVERKDKKYNEIEWESEPAEEGSYDYNAPIDIKLYTPQQHFTNKPLLFATLDLGVGFLDFNSGSTSYLQKSYGFTIGSVGKIGWYFSAMTNFDFKAFHPDYVAVGSYYGPNNQHGDFVDGNYPFYSGESRGSRLSIMGGFLLKMGSRSCLRLGAGYGHKAFAFSDLDGNWIAPARFDKKGLDVALGLQFNNRSHFVFSFDLVSTSFSTLEAKVGMGVCLHKDKVFQVFDK